MASLYDVFYIVAKRGQTTIRDILKDLDKPASEYQNVFNNILILERMHLVEKDKTIRIMNSKNAQKLFDLISFCLRNSINYNILFKPKMLIFLEKASKKEFFNNSNIKIHAQTFKFYAEALSRYGLLIIISKKPFKCKLLKSLFTIDVLKYFKKNPAFYVQKNRSHIPDIKKELRKYKSGIHRYNIVNFEKKREYGFIYSSLNLEGNPLTLPQTQKLLMDDVVPESQKMEAIEETINYKRSIELMIKNSKDKKLLDKKLILYYHSVAMHGKSFGGLIRKENVFIKKNPKFTTSDWKHIEKSLNTLIGRYNAFENEKRNIEEIITFASYFHNEFQRIHPFIDGNSRIARLLMLHILRMHNIPVLELPIGYFDAYMDLTKRSEKRDDERFKYLVEEIVLTNLKNLNNNMINQK